MEAYWLVFIAYLLGSVPTGYILGSLAGVDVRKAGSGNVGATNVARVVSKRYGIFTLIADVAKGFVPVIIALHLDFSARATACVGLAAFLGHLYSAFLRFKGGKGVATALGVLLALAAWPTLVLIPVFAAVLLATRAVSLSSMIAAAAAPLVLWLSWQPPAYVWMSFFMTAMIVLRHRENIHRLLSGTEPKFGAASSR